MANLFDTTLVIGGDPNIHVGAFPALDGNNQQISDLADPTQPQQAATKNYVDTLPNPPFVFTHVLSAFRTTDKNFAPLPADIPQNIEIDGAVNGPADDAQVSAAGLITFNNPGVYRISHQVIVGRPVAAGSAILFGTLLKNGLPFMGTEQDSTLLFANYTDNSNYSALMGCTCYVNAIATDTHQLQAYSDSLANPTIILLAQPNTKLVLNAFSYKIDICKFSI